MESIVLQDSDLGDTAQQTETINEDHVLRFAVQLAQGIDVSSRLFGGVSRTICEWRQDDRPDVLGSALLYHSQDCRDVRGQRGYGLDPS